MTAYLIANNHMTGYGGNLDAYRARVTETAVGFGGRYLLRGVPAKVLEGQWLPRQRNVVSAWPDPAATEAFWFSDAYQKEIRPNRVGTSLNDIGIFEGEGEPPQPGGEHVYMLVLAQIVGAPEAYRAAVTALIPRFGGRFLVRGRPLTVVEGEWLDRLRAVVITFPSMAAATDFWHSQDYQKDVKPMRNGSGIYDVAVFKAET